MNSTRKPALAALTFQLSVTEASAASEIQLTPAGPAFRSADGSGRPADVAAWTIDERTARQVIARMKARANDALIDYEHQTLLTEQNGHPAPAAGWFKELEWREGAGLFAVGVRWTPRAAEMLRAGEYRYISPVFAYNRTTGAVEDVRMAALTNNPGLDGMASVALSAALANYVFSTEKESQMDLKQLLAALGLPDDTDEAAALAALSALKTQADDAQTALAALKAETVAKTDPTKFAPVEVVQSLQQQIAALTANVTASEVATLIADADAAGKLVTAELKAWATDLGKTDVAALKAFLAATPAIAALTGTQTGGKAPETTGKAGLTADQLAVCKAAGISPDDFLKAKE
jgi:phage I-like protein